MLNQDNNFNLISLSILTPCSLDNVQILLGEITCYSLLRVKGLLRGRPYSKTSLTDENIYVFCC